MRRLAALGTEAERLTSLWARRILCEVLDRLGRYGDGDEVSGDTDSLLSELRRAELPETETQETLIVEKCWCCLMKSVCKHRDGQLGTAVELSRVLDAQIRRLLPDDAKYQRPLEMLRRILEWQLRSEYALGRHHQSRGDDDDEADARFGAAIENLTRYTRAIGSDASLSGKQVEAENQFVRYWSGNVLIGFARVRLDRGQLTTATLHLNVASTCLSGSSDFVNRAFVDFLKGCVLRQEDRRGEAEKYLILARSQFAAADNRHFSSNIRVGASVPYSCADQHWIAAHKSPNNQVTGH